MEKRESVVLSKADFQEMARWGRYFGEKIKKNLIVKHSNMLTYDDMLADFCSKEDMAKNRYANSFGFRLTEGYYASFIVKGLRVKDEGAIIYFLLYILLRELASMKYIREFEDCKEIVNEIGDYIQEKWGIVCGGRLFLDRGIPMDTFPTELLNMVFKEWDIEKLCRVCIMFWKDFFYDNGLVTYKISEIHQQYHPYDYPTYMDKWPGYIVLAGEAKVYIGCSEGLPKYKRVSEIILEEKYKKINVEDCVPTYLDGNTLNLSEENIVLFKDEYHLARWSIGGARYSINEDNIYYVQEEIAREELKRILRRYSNEYIYNIYSTNAKGLKDIMERYKLPTKSIINKMSDEEFEQV